MAGTSGSATVGSGAFESNLAGGSLSVLMQRRAGGCRTEQRGDAFGVDRLQCFRERSLIGGKRIVPSG